MNTIVLFLILFIFGFMFFIIGMVSFFSSKKFISHSTIITGTVIDIVKSRSSSSENRYTYFCPCVEYFDPYYREKRVFTSNSGHNPPKYKIGDTVKLRYFNDNGKSKLAIDSFFSIWNSNSIQPYGFYGSFNRSY